MILKPAATVPISTRYFWVVFFILVAVSLFPFWHFRYPALADYPNHLARVSILAGAAHESWVKHYDINLELIPNLALDFFVPLVMQVGLSPESGLRLFSVVAFIFPVMGTLALSFQINKSTPWITLFAIPLAWNRYYVWGFLNYFFSLGLSLILIAYWLKITETASSGHPQAACRCSFPQRVHLLLFSIGIFCLLLSHLVGVVLFLVTVLSYEVFKALKNPQMKFGNTAKFISTAFPSIIGYLFFFHHNEYGLQIYYYDFILSKFVGLAAIVFTYALIPAIVTLSIVAAAFLVARYIYHARIGIPVAFLPPIIALLFVFLFAPGAMMGSAFLDRRLFVFICFLTLATVKIDYSRSVCAILVIAAIGLVGVKVTEVWTVWKAANISLSAIRKELLAIPPGGNLLQHPILPLGLRDDTDLLRHASAFAVIDRGVFIPTLFAQPFNGESIRYIDSKNNPHFKASLGEPLSGPKDINIRWPSICAGYEYVLLTGVVEGIEYPSCVKKMASSRTFVLLSVIKNSAQQPPTHP